jgi:hypothetical protein
MYQIFCDKINNSKNKFNSTHPEYVKFNSHTGYDSNYSEHCIKILNEIISVYIDTLKNINIINDDNCVLFTQIFNDLVSYWPKHIEQLNNAASVHSSVAGSMNWIPPYSNNSFYSEELTKKWNDAKIMLLKKVNDDKIMLLKKNIIQKEYIQKVLYREERMVSFYANKITIQYDLNIIVNLDDYFQICNKNTNINNYLIFDSKGNLIKNNKEEKITWFKIIILNLENLEIIDISKDVSIYISELHINNCNKFKKINGIIPDIILINGKKIK